MRKSVLHKLIYCFVPKPRPVFSYPLADSYHLPEGRFYAAPLIVKEHRKQKAKSPIFLAMGFSFVSASALQQQPPPAVPANTTIFSALPGSLSLRNRDTYIIAADRAGSQRQIERFGTTQNYRRQSNTENIVRMASLDGLQSVKPAHLFETEGHSDKINRSGKGNSVLGLHHNNGLHLVNYDLHYAALAEDSSVRSFTQALKNQRYEAYVVRFMPPRAKTKIQIATGFVPAPHKPKLPNLPVPHMLVSLVNNNKPDILALGYASAPVNPLEETPFDSILTDSSKKNEGRFIPPVSKADYPWAATPLPASVFTPPQQKCLAEAVYFEARSESLKGQAAVAQVVLNRVRNPAYPNTVCGVVYQNVNWYNRCQFSFACDGKKHRVTELRPWHTAQAVAKAVSAGQIWLADIGSATHYHAVYVHPQWAAFMDKMEKIGNHIFYRSRNGGWS